MSNETFYRRLDEYLPDQAPPPGNTGPVKWLRENLFSGPVNSIATVLIVALFAWSEEAFLKKTEGSAIRRIGHERWLRNVAVALGNAPSLPEVIDALRSRKDHPSEVVREHVAWALARHLGSAT